jgi:hypothetical protein
VSLRGQNRFLEDFDSYLEAVIQQAADRDESRIRDVESYMMVRRHTVGAFPTFRALEFSMNVPNEVMKHSVIQELEVACADMLSIGNVSTALPHRCA